MVEVRLFSQGEHTGTVTLDEHGVAVADTASVQAFIEQTGVMEPDTVTPLSPSDGERYLRAMPANFHGAYFWAGFYDGGEPVKQPWLMSQGGTVPDPPPTDWEKCQAIIANSKHARFVKGDGGKTVIFLGSKRAADAFKKNIGK